MLMNFVVFGIFLVFFFCRQMSVLSEAKEEIARLQQTNSKEKLQAQRVKVGGKDWEACAAWNCDGSMV